MWHVLVMRSDGLRSDTGACSGAVGLCGSGAVRLWGCAAVLRLCCCAVRLCCAAVSGSVLRLCCGCAVRLCCAAVSGAVRLWGCGAVGMWGCASQAHGCCWPMCGSGSAKATRIQGFNKASLCPDKQGQYRIPYSAAQVLSDTTAPPRAGSRPLHRQGTSRPT
jgi:hypothetical protein